MSRNGSGVYSLPAGNPVVTGTTISSSWANTTLSDIATALTGSVAADGQTAMTGNLQMGNNKVTGLAVATTSGDALSYAQAATVSDLAVTGNATVGGTLTLTGGLTLNGNVTVGDSSSDTLTVNATSTFAAGATFSSTFAANGGVTLGDASGDALTINSSAVSIPNGLNFDSNTFVIDATNNYVGIGTASPTFALQVETNTDAVAGSFIRNTNTGSSASGNISVASGVGNLILRSHSAAHSVWANSTLVQSDSGFTGGLNILQAGANPIKFWTNGTERMRIDSSGNLGLGVTPSTGVKLQLADGQIIGSAGNYIALSANGGYSSGSWRYVTSTSAARYDQDAGVHKWFYAASGTAGNAITFTQAMTLDSSGNLGVGTTSSLKGVTSALSTATNYQFTARDTRSMAANVGGGIAFEGNDGTLSDRAFGVIIGAKENSTSGNYAGYLAFYSRTNGSSPAERMRIDSSGNVGIGTSSPNYKLSIYDASTPRIQLTNSTSGTATTDGYVIYTSGTAAYFLNREADATYFGNNNTVQATLDSSGNLGLGVTPSAWSGWGSVLQLGYGSSLSSPSSGLVFLGNNFYYNAGYKYIATGYATMYRNGSTDGQHLWYTAPSGTAGNAITFTQVMTLDASGNLIVGGTSPLSSAANRGNITVNGTDSVVAFGNSGSNSGYVYVSSSQMEIATISTRYMNFNTGGSERMRIDSSGNLLVGTTSGSSKTNIYQSADSIGLIVRNANASNTSNVLNISADRNTTNNSYYFIRCDVVGVAYRFQVADSGNVTNTNNSYGAISDVKLKENIVDATPKLEDLCKVKVRQYNLKADPDHKQLGVIAQELEEVFPAMIEETADRDEEGNDLETTTKSVKYSVFVPMLIKAVQELNAKVTALEAQLNK